MKSFFKVIENIKLELFFLLIGLIFSLIILIIAVNLELSNPTVWNQVNYKLKVNDIINSDSIKHNTANMKMEKGKNNQNNYYIFYSDIYPKEVRVQLEKQNQISSHILRDRKSVSLSYIEDQELNSEISQRFITTIEYLWQEDKEEFSKAGEVKQFYNLFFTSSQISVELKDIIQDESQLMALHRTFQANILKKHSNPEEIIKDVLEMDPLSFQTKVNITPDSIKVMVDRKKFGFSYVSVTYKEISPHMNLIINKETQELNKKHNRKEVALTFDDGPSDATTIELLKTLRKEKIVATFFVLGENVESNPNIAKRIVLDGHEIANHSYSHPDFTTLSTDEIREEINETDKQIFLKTGRLPEIFRPPYGSVNKEVSRAVRLPIIQWDVDTEDWSLKNSEKILKNVIESIKDGSIILLHDIHKESVDSVPSIIDYLRKQDYEFVTVTDLLSNKQKPYHQYFNQYEMNEIK